MKRLFAAAAMAPLCLAASTALAQTTVTTNTTDPLATSTSGDIQVNSGGGVTVRTGGPAITVDSDNNVTDSGTVSVRDSTTGGTAILVTTGTGRAGNISINGDVAGDDTVADVKDDKGVIHGPFVTPGTVRYGIRVTGAGTYTGNIVSPSSGVVSIKGDGGSAAVSIESNMVGNLDLEGSLGAAGDNSFALHTTGSVTGNITLSSAVQAQGLNATAVALDGSVDGLVRIDGQISSSGFRYLHTADVPTGGTVSADDLLIGGPTVRIMSNVTHGFILDAPPPITDFTDTDGDGNPDNIDQDGDGVTDSLERTGTIDQFGSAPAVLVGSASAITLGNVATSGRDTLQLDRDQFGFIIRGILSSNGVYPGIASLGVQIAGLGGTVDTSGGVAVTGQINSEATNASATGLILGSGAKVPIVNNDGGLISAGSQTIAGTVVSSRGIQIDAGATVNTLNNGGTIKAGMNGPAGSAVAVLDNSGTLSTINNTDTILASALSVDGKSPAVGDQIALDLRANTTGVTITQSQNPTSANAVSTIGGDILFGTGDFNDNLIVNTGVVSGTIAFGGGTDTLAINGGATVTGGIQKTTGALDVNVSDGTLTLSKTNAANISSLEAGATSTLTFSADPTNADPTQRVSELNVSGQASFDSGSQIKVQFLHKLLNDQTFTVLTAGSLVDNGLITDLTNQIPALFTGQLVVGANSITLDAQRRTAAQLQLAGGSAEEFNAFYQAFDSDTGVASDILSKTSIGDFDKLYKQFLPDYSGGPFQTLARTTREGLAAQAESSASLPADQPHSWLQEVGLTVKQQTIDDIPYQTGGFGVIGGFERPVAGGGVAGLSGSFMSSEIRNEDRFLGSHLAASAVTLGAYWRQSVHNLNLDADVTGGLGWFDSVRKIVDQDSAGTQLLVRQADGSWNGGLAAARFGATYNLQFGPVYLRPSADIDGVYLGEDGYKESGGGTAVDLTVNSRSNYEAGAQAGVVIGGMFGRSFHWGPELEVGYRSIFASGDGETSAAFSSVPGMPFTLSGVAREKGLLIVRAALRGEGPFSNFAFELGGEMGNNYDAYTARFAVRFVF